MALLTNDTHTQKGDSTPSIQSFGRVSKPQKSVLKDSDNREFEHTIPHVVAEANKPIVDQLLSAKDFKLSNLIALGSELQRVVPTARDRFESMDLTMATLNRFALGDFDKPQEPTVGPTVAPTVQEPLKTD